MTQKSSANLNSGIDALVRIDAIRKLEAARQKFPEIGTWIAAELKAGRSPEYVVSVLKATVDEAKRMQAGAK